MTGKGKSGPFLELIERLRPGIEGHEVEADAAWLLDAAELQLPRREAEAEAEWAEGEVDRALEERSEWQTDHAAAVRGARRELSFVVASSVGRGTRPLALEASHSGAALLLSEGPPLPVGDALHLVMERVALPGAEDLEEVVESVCGEAGLLEWIDEVGEMARRCLVSEAVKRAVGSGHYWREVPFTVPRNEGFTVGHLDLVYQRANRLWSSTIRRTRLTPRRLRRRHERGTPARPRFTRRQSGEPRGAPSRGWCSFFRGGHGSVPTRKKAPIARIRALRASGVREATLRPSAPERNRAPPPC